MQTNKVVIFGNTQTAELANYYLEKDTDYDVVAFTADTKFLDSDKFENKPIVAFEEIEKLYPPSGFLLFAPLTAVKMNSVRERVFNQGKLLGYNFCSYISTKATVLSDQIGENCFILEDNTIQPKTQIGNNCVLWSGNHIGHHSTIGHHNFFTSHVVLSGNCKVADNCFFGVNATIRDYCDVAKGTLVGMDASLNLKRTEEWGIYTGVPARLNNRRKSYEIM